NEVASEFTTKIIDKLSHVKARVNIHTRNSCQCINEHLDSPLLNISVGVGGKYELTKTTSQIMEKIQNGECQPEDITPELIESHLLFKHEPDMVIRSGGKQLTDFLIWQSAYSELYFTDVSWINFRYIDLLRAIRDYQKRKRKFGR
ncbi:MAG: undecaprenyl diphosphate synthase family protein, partial [Methanosarcinales archaeon]|nr:undecaprenyl diphosphate synthase family protein [Methanosarcinales archaeon]